MNTRTRATVVGFVLFCSSPISFAASDSSRIGNERSNHEDPATISSELGIPPGPVLAWAIPQSCDGTRAAVLLKWIPAENALATYTVERLDGGYSATVDSSENGFAHLVTEGLEYGQGYDFEVVAHNHFDSTPSNLLSVYVVNEECAGAETPGSPPGPFVPWMEPVFCYDGQPAVELHWSASAGSTSYTLERYASTGGSRRTVPGIQGTYFLDDVDIVGGVAHAYTIEAANPAGTSSSYPNHLDLFPAPDLCGESDLPGDFTLTAGTPYCLNGEPAIPIDFTASSGADDHYRVRVFVNGGDSGGTGFGASKHDYHYEVTAGVRSGGIHELFMIATDAQDETKVRFSNSVYLKVPAEICGALGLPPEVYTQPSNGITASSAVLRSQVKANGSSTFAYFEWGTTTPYTDLTSPVPIGSDALYVQRPSRQVVGLECETEYHYRVVAWNAYGTSIGVNRTFDAGPCPDCGENDLVLSGRTVVSAEAYEACSSITLGPNLTVESGASLQLTAPMVIFEEGLIVKSGGSLSAGPPP